MAMTPVYNEVNRIQVSSPVPIGGSEQARAAAETNDALGKAIFDLGNAMDNQKEDKGVFRLLGETAGAKLSVARKKAEDTLRTQYPMLESSGVPFAEKVDEVVAPIKEQMLNELDPRSHIYFEHYAAEDLKHQVGSFLKTGVDGYTDRAKSAFNDLMQAKIEQTIADPTTLPIRLTEIELSIEESNMPDSEKPGEIKKRQAATVMALSEKLRNDGQDGNLASFDESKKLLQYYTHLIDPKDLGNETKEVIESRYSTTSRFRTDIDWNLKEKDRKEKEVKAVNYTKIAKMFADADSPAKLIVAEQAGQKLVNNRLLDNEQLTAAKTGPKYIQELGDDLFQSKIQNQMVQEKGAYTVPKGKSAVQKINDQYAAGLITPDRHAKLLQFANTLRENKVDRARFAIVEGFKSNFDALNKDTILAPGDDQFKQERAIQAKTFGALFKQEALTYPDKDVTALYNKYMGMANPGYKTDAIKQNTIPNTPQAAQVNNATVEDYMPVLKARVLKAQKSGDAVELQKANDALYKAYKRTRNK